MTMTVTHPASTPLPSAASIPDRAEVATKRSPARRLAGLDGLRALAVVSVVVFHLDSNWLPGGFLGVDLFFVISGFLITRMLLTEFADSGRIRIGHFYGRRARRLFPAAAALIGVTTIASLVVWRDELATLAGSVTSSLSYVTNWWLIFHHESYFVADGRPPMLQHLWSLAIEEQYYLVWAGVLVVVTCALSGCRNRVRRVQLVAVIAALLAIGSTIAMAAIAVHDNIPYAADSSRVYFGTDTHSAGLLLGSAAGALAVVLAMRPQRRRRVALGQTDLLGLAALAAVIYAMCHVNEYRPGLYRGGFLAFDLICVVVVCTASRRGSWFGRLLDRQPMRWLGERSYSIYLWHWPVIVVTRPGVDIHGPFLVLQAARVALILALSAISYHWVEQRFRVHAKRPSTPRRRVSRPGLVLAGAGVASAVLLASCSANADANRYPGPAAAVVPTVSPRPSPHSAPALPQRHAAAQARAVGRQRAHQKPAPLRTHTPARAAGAPAVSAFGDSVLLDAGPTLDSLDHSVAVDAVVGRQAYDTLNDVTTDEKAGRLAPIVVIHIGDNGVIEPSQLNSTLQLLHSKTRVVLINDRVPREWQDSNNSLLAEAASQYPNVVLLNWYALSAGHDSWFYSDEVHLTPQGAPHFARMILAAAEGKPVAS
jgi:peptidoglycan/LPS O-acetylase OafA/YrhL